MNLPFMMIQMVYILGQVWVLKFNFLPYNFFVILLKKLQFSTCRIAIRPSNRNLLLMSDKSRKDSIYGP